MTTEQAFLEISLASETVPGPRHPSLPYSSPRDLLSPWHFQIPTVGWTWDSVLGSKPSFTPINSLSIPLGSQTHSDGIFIYMQLVEPVTTCSNLNPPSPPSIPYSGSPFPYTCIRLSLWQCVWIQGFLHPLAFPIHPPGIPYPPIVLHISALGWTCERVLLHLRLPSPPSISYPSP